MAAGNDWSHMNHFKDDCIASSSLPEIRAYGGRLEAKPTSRLSFGMSGATPDFTVDTSDSGDGVGLLEAQSRDSLMVTINAANSGMRTLFAPPVQRCCGPMRDSVFCTENIEYLGSGRPGSDMLQSYYLLA